MTQAQYEQQGAAQEWHETEGKTMKSISGAFIKAKRAFGPALKDKTNPAFRSKYADLGACIDAVEPALLDNGIAFIQETFDDATGVTVETVFLHESGESIRCGRLHVPAAKQDPQGFGSALTYARRYSLMTACGIAPEDDDGNAAAKSQVDEHGRILQALREASMLGTDALRVLKHRLHAQRIERRHFAYGDLEN